MVEGTALEKRQARKGLGSSNLPLSVCPNCLLGDNGRRVRQRLAWEVAQQTDDASAWDAVTGKFEYDASAEAIPMQHCDASLMECQTPDMSAAES